MKKHVFFHRLLIFIISVAMILSLTSCAQQKKPIPQPKKSEEEQNKPPKELDELSKAVEKIEKTLLEMHERSKLPLFIQQEEIMKQEEKKKKEEDQGGGGQGGNQQSGGGGGGSSGGGSGGGSGAGGGGQQGQGQQGQGQQTSQVELVTPQAQQAQMQLEVQKMKLEIEKANLAQFEELKKSSLELHGLWNAFEAKAEKQFVMQTSIVEFEDAMNALTKSLDKNLMPQSLLDATQLYKYLPDFYLAYTPEYPPEIDKVRYAIKKTQLLGELKNYAGAKETLDYLAAVWMQTKPKLNKDSKDMTNQMEFAIQDLSKAIEEQNSTIIKAKSEVILKVADELEKTNSKKEKKK